MVVLSDVGAPYTGPLTGNVLETIATTATQSPLGDSIDQCAKRRSCNLQGTLRKLFLSPNKVDGAWDADRCSIFSGRRELPIANERGRLASPYWFGSFLNPDEHRMASLIHFEGECDDRLSSHHLQKTCRISCRRADPITSWIRRTQKMRTGDSLRCSEYDSKQVPPGFLRWKQKFGPDVRRLIRWYSVYSFRFKGPASCRLYCRIIEPESEGLNHVKIGRRAIRCNGPNQKDRTFQPCHPSLDRVLRRYVDRWCWDRV